MLFTQATAEDEAEIRRLLRENPVPGRMPVSFEREPNGFAGPQLAGARRCFVLAREEANGPAIGLCERIVRSGFVDGEERLIAYLGALRVAESHRRRIAIIKGGFRALRNVERPDEWPVALTSIADDNIGAKRLLTKGISGLPTYRPIGGLVSMVMRPRKVSTNAARELSPAQYPELSAFLEREMRWRQFSTRWTVDDLRGLTGATFLGIIKGGELMGCVSLWDQREYRQTVIHNYSPLLGAVRPMLNVLGGLIGSPQLPPPGAVLRQAFVSHLASRGSDPGIALDLVTSALDLAARRGVAAAILGVPAGHPWRTYFERRFRSIQYRTTLYGVFWQESAQARLPSARTHIFPEIALL